MVGLGCGNGRVRVCAWWAVGGARCKVQGALCKVQGAWRVMHTKAVIGLLLEVLFQVFNLQLKVALLQHVGTAL